MVVSRCFLYALVFSYKLNISNGLSLMTLNSEEFTLCSGSFKWGQVNHKIYPPGGKSENLSSFQVLLLLHRALLFLIRNERPKRLQWKSREEEYSLRQIEITSYKSTLDLTLTIQKLFVYILMRTHWSVCIMLCVQFNT